MKKLITLTIALFLLAAVNVFGQSVPEEVTVTANVDATLILSSTDVSFGDVNAGSIAYVNAGTGDSRSSENSSSPSAGSLEITADSDANLNIYWTNGTLTDSDGNNPTIFTPAVFFSGDEIENSGDDITLTGTTGTVDIGGELAAITGGTGGFSTANDNGSPVVFTVEYN